MRSPKQPKGARLQEPQARARARRRARGPIQETRDREKMYYEKMKYKLRMINKYRRRVYRRQENDRVRAQNRLCDLSRRAILLAG